VIVLYVSVLGVLHHMFLPFIFCARPAAAVPRALYVGGSLQVSFAFLPSLVIVLVGEGFVNIFG